MKTSNRRKIASQTNGALSKGPQTPAGKAISSANSLRHGMLAKTVVLHNENPDIFKLLHESFVLRFAPCDEVERSFVEEMAVCHWRIRRGWAVETELWNQGIDRQSLAADADGEVARMAAAFSELAVSPPLGLLNRYEARLHRIFQRALKNLLELRESRPPAETGVQPLVDPLPTESADSKEQPSAKIAEIQNCQSNLIPETGTAEPGSQDGTCHPPAGRAPDSGEPPATYTGANLGFNLAKTAH